MSLFKKLLAVKDGALAVTLGKTMQIELKVDKSFGEGLMDGVLLLGRDEQRKLDPQGPNMVPYVGGLRKTITFFQGGLVVSWPV